MAAGETVELRIAVEVGADATQRDAAAESLEEELRLVRGARVTRAEADAPAGTRSAAGVLSELVIDVVQSPELVTSISSVVAGWLAGRRGRIRVKIGDNEAEYEGADRDVTDSFARWFEENASG
jgi:hypothetical protein